MAEESRSIRLIRPEDLLVLDITLVNLAPGGDGLLRAVDPATPARLVIGLPPQHVAESAFLEFQTWNQPAGPPPVRAVAAEPSRLAFDVPADGPGIPFTVAGLLDWAGLQPALAPNALPPGTAAGPRPAAPAADVTALELPYRLVLSPVTDASWRHRTEPFVVDGVAELWHTRLAGPAESAPPVLLRAIHGRLTDPFVSSLAVREIADLVTLTGDFGNGPKSFTELGIPLPLWRIWVRRVSEFGQPVVPAPATLRAERLLLTSLGATAHILGKFDFPRDTQKPADLEQLGVTVPVVQQYEHITGLGRDQYVKVVRRGCLDTGHRASIVKITERRFEPVSLGSEPGPHGPVGVFGTTAYLRQYFRVVVQQPFLDYRPMHGGYPHDSREMPLRTIALRTLETPKIDLDIDLTDEITPEQIEHALSTPFWIRSDHKPVPFDFDSTDWEGRTVSGTKAMMFIPYQAVRGTDAVIAAFNGSPPGARTATLHAQQLALAEPVPGRPDATSAPTEYLTFDLVKVTSSAGMPRDYLPGWLPQALTAGVHLEPVEQLTGSARTVELRLAAVYLDHGLDPGANPAAMYAAYPAVPFAVRAETGGGVAAPALQLDALSATQGVMPAAMATGVDQNVLKALLAGMKLFGTVDLASLLAPIPPPVAAADPALLAEADLDRLLADPTALVRVPIVRTRPVPDAAGVPTATLTRMLWKPALLPMPDVTPAFELGQAQFVLDVRTVTRLDGSAPETTIRGELRGFSLTFAGVVRVSMGTLRFLSLPGRKPDITAEGVGLDFVGALQFVNTIRDLMPADGFSDPPAITVTPEGILAGFSLGIPTVGVGVFSLQNLNLSAALSLPFVGKPAGLRFALSERHHPFLVTVTLFGGGGFFALGVSAAGVEEIEASIEFGGNVSLNLGVASGGVYVMAGVYFAMSATKGTELTGYLRCGGYLSVLGLISISLEFYLAFTYRDKGGGRSEIWGQASLTVSVKVVCFSTSVTLSVERRFAGAAGDPTLEQVIDESDWQAYCLAFAEEPA
ncbi:MAG TPA: hypothetical protein VFJ97_02865 [Dermatophilaceae bacterium]|nr:hypothetical protein [Dermatophilaceae bacterium]